MAAASEALRYVASFLLLDALARAAVQGCAHGSVQSTSGASSSGGAAGLALSAFLSSFAALALAVNSVESRRYSTVMFPSASTRSTLYRFAALVTIPSWVALWQRAPLAVRIMTCEASVLSDSSVLSSGDQQPPFAAICL